MGKQREIHAWSNAASHGLTTILYSVADLYTHASYLMITSTTYASRYGPLRFGLPSNRLQVCMYVLYDNIYLLCQ